MNVKNYVAVENFRRFEFTTTKRENRVLFSGCTVMIYFLVTLLELSSSYKPTMMHIFIHFLP